MRAKLTSKNQIAIPKSVISAFEGTEYFDVAEDDGRIVLAPVSVGPAETASVGLAESISEKLANPGLTPQDLLDIVALARERRPDPAEADAVWEKIERLGITEQDVADAVEWARCG